MEVLTRPVRVGSGWGRGVSGGSSATRAESGTACSGGAFYEQRRNWLGTMRVSAVVDFYRRAFDLEVRFWDEALGFAELETGASVLAIAAHSLGEMLMGSGYSRPADGHPSGVEIGFLTGEVPVAFDKAVAQGATPITAPRRMPWGLEVAYVRGPEGTMIGFSEPPPRPIARK